MRRRTPKVSKSLRKEVQNIRVGGGGFVVVEHHPAEWAVHEHPHLLVQHLPGRNSPVAVGNRLCAVVKRQVSESLDGHHTNRAERAHRPRTGVVLALTPAAVLQFVPGCFEVCDKLQPRLLAILNRHFVPLSLCFVLGWLGVR